MRISIHLPVALTATRAVLAPLLLLLAFAWPNETVFGVVLVLALISDVLDGVIARKLGVATPGLRRFDSVTDSVFYLCAVVASWHVHETQLREFLIPLVILLLLELARYTFDYIKFRREASYHMWSSRAWGAALFVGFFSLLALGQGGWPIALAIYLGIVADVEGLAISVVLKKWQTDVPTIFRALQLRRSEA
ncbi:MAG: CDP-alcohol phosphatidyltransferase family protein [Gemmatimonadaceae bacterium]